MAGSALDETLQQFGLYSPRTLTLALTGACNLSCSHCFVGAGEAGSAGHVPGTTLVRLISEFARLGGEGVRLTGGEPLCHPQWLELLRLAVAAGFSSVSLQTNAMLLDDRAVATLRELDFPGLAIQVSFDGASAASHDLVRGPGAFDSLMSAMGKLSRAGLAGRTSIFFTEMRHNLDEIPSLLLLAEQLGVSAVATGALVACGRAADDARVQPPTPSQYLRLLERHRADRGFARRYQKLGKVAALEWRLGDAPRLESCTFVQHPYLDARGRLYPCVLCHADPYCVSGVFQKKLADAFAEGAPLWAGLLEASRSRSRCIPGCRACPERESCGGGCLGRAWGSSRDVMAADDRCAARRAVRSWKSQ